MSLTVMSSNIKLKIKRLMSLTVSHLGLIELNERIRHKCIIYPYCVIYMCFRNTALFCHSDMIKDKMYYYVGHHDKHCIIFTRFLK